LKSGLRDLSCSHHLAPFLHVQLRKETSDRADRLTDRGTKENEIEKIPKDDTLTLSSCFSQTPEIHHIDPSDEVESLPPGAHSIPTDAGVHAERGQRSPGEWWRDMMCVIAESDESDETEMEGWG
jgi:hypothetical protein